MRSDAVNYLLRLPLTELRRRQALNSQQIAAAHRQHNTKALEELRERELELDRAVELKAFGRGGEGSDVPSEEYLDNGASYYVWPLGKGNVPLSGEGPFGPYPLENAKTTARIRATNGGHDYAVTRGENPTTLEVVRVYERGTGEHAKNAYDPTWGPIPDVRWGNKYSIGDAGAVYEFNVKMHHLRGVNIDDDGLYLEVEEALERFAEKLRDRYSWIGDVSLTGRSGGWLAIEDAKGKARQSTLRTISELVRTELNAFQKYLRAKYGEQAPNGDVVDAAQRFRKGPQNPPPSDRQPFRGSDLVILEKRNRPDGRLDFSDPQPPPDPMTFDKLYKLYFRHSETGTGSWNDLRAWLESMHFVVRAKSW